MQVPVVPPHGADVFHLVTTRAHYSPLPITTRQVHCNSKCGGILQVAKRYWTQTFWGMAFCISIGRNPQTPLNKSTEPNQGRAWPYSVLSVLLKLKLSALKPVQLLALALDRHAIQLKGRSTASTRWGAFSSCQIYMDQFSEPSKGHQSNPRQWVQWEKPEQTPATIIYERLQVTS